MVFLNHDPASSLRCTPFMNIMVSVCSLGDSPCLTDNRSFHDAHIDFIKHTFSHRFFLSSLIAPSSLFVLCTTYHSPSHHIVPLHFFLFCTYYFTHDSTVYILCNNSFDKSSCRASYSLPLRTYSHIFDQLTFPDISHHSAFQTILLL